MSMQRFLGGSLGSVLVKLIFVSLLVGAFMAALGITPMGLIDRLGNMLQGILNLGWGTVKQVGLWLIYGAMIVIPIWLILRIIGYFR
ncbi:DUF6460 domain-containing protein [Microvirga sp. W0021]|uniref:DUF6460 domain-containing protein n=1 Tax=Hohaiivirga grylli TaxID=3133970 RepID=A0ABV0BJ37_9HYPH